MQNVSSRFRDFVRDERAATAIEYALIAGGISIAILAGVTTLGGSVTAMWTIVRDALAG